MGADLAADDVRCLKVLVVEDNPADVRLIREELREVPFVVHELTDLPSLAHAIERLTAKGDRAEIDVVVLDLSLPDATGLDGLRRVIDAAPHTPVIVLTGLDDEELALQALQDGAQDYLVKGRIDGALVVRSLRYAVERKRAEQSARREEEAARTSQLRERFLGILGHDLRNPLNAIVASAAFLSLKPLPNEEERRSVQRIARSAERMSRMIDDVLDFTRARLGGGFELHLEACDLERVCRNVIDEFAGAAPDRSIRLEGTSSSDLLCDPDRIAQVLSNLLSNAIRYGASGTPISVGLRSRGDETALSVTNQGTTIPDETRPTLFDPFQRGSTEADPTRGLEGLGLGLYIVQQIVHAHGGRVDVSSRDWDGTTFTVVLPHARTS